jgi:hypothetical protein
MELTKADIAVWRMFGKANVRSEMKRILFSLLSYLQYYFLALSIIKTAYSHEADPNRYVVTLCERGSEYIMRGEKYRPPC